MRVPTGTGHSEIEVRRSRFIGFAGPFESPEDLKARVLSLRSDHPGCSHVTYAFVTGAAGERVGMSDDHEPHGTAGEPMLEVVQGRSLTNLIVLVVRYFGGTKLGTGGLARAYTEACRRALEAMPSEELVLRSRFTLEIDYAHYDSFQVLMERVGATVEDVRFEVAVRVDGLIADTGKEEFELAVADLTRGACRVVYEPA